MMRDFTALPVVEAWFEIDAADEFGVRRIREPYANGGSIWFVEDTDRCLLVDTGIGVAPMRTFCETITNKPIVAFASVGYYDHAGGLHQFDERIIHQNDAWRVQKPNPQNTVVEFYFAQSLRALPSKDFDQAKYETVACEPTRLVVEGDTIDLGNRSFKVLHLPGVTDGACGLFEPNTGILFTGEALVWDGADVYDGEPVDRSSDANPESFCRSIARLRELPASAVYPGHGERKDPGDMRKVIKTYLAQSSTTSNS